jgi:SAM-dependent methyltransferase
VHVISSTKQEWNAACYAANARYVSELGHAVVDLLAPRPGERILDLGCGDGALTQRLHASGCRVVGVDASAEMVKAACAVGVDARVLDAHALPFTAEFDAVFSNAALHWMSDPSRVVDGVSRALKPGGRFVGEFGGHGNVARIVAALDARLAVRGLQVQSPWYFPRAEEFSALLAVHGLIVQVMDLFARPTVLPGDISGWLDTFARHNTAVVAENDRTQFIAEVVRELRSDLCDAEGVWRADYVRLRFAAIKAHATESFGMRAE